jgi:ankyrin repeat protein
LLHLASSNCDLKPESISTIIKESDILAVNTYGMSVLHVAAAHSNFKIMRSLLLNANGNVLVNATDNYKSTPLHSACNTSRNNSEIIKLLQSHGCDLEARDNSGKTALHISCSMGNKENVLALIRMGGNVNAKSDEGWTCLFWSVCIGVVDFIDILLENGADPNICSRDAESPLYRGLTSVHASKIIKKLLLSGADVNYKNGSKGSTEIYL